MEASKQHRTGPLSHESGRAANAGGTLSAVGRLIERADALHLRAPELALVLGERAAALSEAAGADEQWIRSESLVVSARVRLGERPGTVGRAVAALRAAEHAGYGDIAARLRIDLAVCARSLGVPLTGLAALRPVLTDPVVSPVHRAAALTHLVGCLGLLGRKAELDRALVEADKLVLGDESLSADTQLLVRALLRVGTAAHRRRHGDLTAAADAARTGLGFLEKLDNPADDGGLVRIRLVLLLVSTLLDRGDAEMAYEIAEPVLAEPVRAAGVAPMGWLRLAVATRIHLSSGSGEAAIELVREAVASTDRHGLSAVTARLWLELAQLEERFGQPEEAIACLYRSRAAEQLHARARRQACGVLAGEFGTGEPASVDLDEVLKAVPSRPIPVVAEVVAVPEPSPRTPGWSFGREETPKPEPRQPAPAWSFERPRVTADAAETSLMPAVRDEPAEPRVRPEPVAVERRRPEPAEAKPTGRRGLEPIEVRSASVEPVRRSESVELPRREPVRRSEPAEPPRHESEPIEVRSASVEPVRRSEPVESPRREPEPIEVRSASAEPVRRPDSVEPQRPEPIEVRSAPADPPWRRESPGQARPIPAAPEPAEAPPSGRRRAPELPAEPIEVRTAPERRAEPAETRAAAPEPPAPQEIEKPKFSWAALAEARLRETAAERESAPTRITPALPLAPEPAAEREPRREPQPSTRHDAEHGSEAAQSVLDRLGISSSGGASGGRRRAEDAETRADDSPRRERAEPELAPPPRPEDEPPSVPDYRDEAEPWLPRLRMPPSLEPMEDFGHWTPATAPFPESYARAIAEDEPPPDAGLADLLARALAEHQAGTASAAALVKQLGSKDTGRRNGHGRNGHGAEVPDSRRHGSGD
ncbi:hypothetical protein Amsp01_056760 [Amycolatopsis sp. NBRC 101858]|uniref:tetratricopeptide repeat protein n=1 Tax=Amycolatopsis sp. NBRC 101858 TaxID=3032200 RepID=UPI0024A2F4D5|nr:hypothetical protein [Amycolatopsis sp. NBRC 101858]GLY39652.1 hypothetical protein Amsp01_056760 [Amycolatopsis sp. NBRC 101858]